MYQLELVFQLLVHLQCIYFQYNMYLSIVVCINIQFIYIIYTHARDWRGCKNSYQWSQTLADFTPYYAHNIVHVPV